MGGEGLSLRQLQVKYRDVQPPFGGDAGIFLPQGAGGGVAGIGHQGLALNLQGGVDLLEHRAGHVDLATDDEPGQLVRQRLGQGGDGADILRHVLPYPAVATGGATVEDAVAVLHRHAETVHLGLHAVTRTGQFPGHTLQKGADLVLVEHVLQALQRYGMGHLGKVVQQPVAHPLGGGIGGDGLGVGRLQVLQAAVQAVIFIVRHGGRVQGVIQPGGLVELLPKLLNLQNLVHNATSYPMFIIYSSAYSSVVSRWPWK